MPATTISVIPYKKEHLLRMVIVITASFIIIFGSAMVLFWLSYSIYPITNTLAKFLNIKFNTSIAFIASGAGLVATLRTSKQMAFTMGCLVFIIGGATLLEYLTDTNLYIDELFWHDLNHSNNPYPGRMAQNSAFTFTCAGISIMLAANNSIKSWQIITIESLIFLVFILGIEGAFRNLSGNTLTYNWGSYTNMTPQSAVGFIALGIGLLSMAWSNSNISVAHMLLWVSGLICFIIFMADLMTPLGATASIAYIPFILLSIWFREQKAPFIFATITTGLTIFGVLLSSDSDVPIWIVTLNRTLTIIAMWFAAILVYLRYKTDQSLESSNNKLSILVDYSLDGLISTNKQGVIEYFNPACERIFGYNCAEVIGKNISMLIREPCSINEISAANTNANKFGYEANGVTKNGDIIVIGLSLNNFNFNDSIHFSGTIRDITELKAAEQKLLHYTHALERSNKELNIFAHVLVHDIKQPISSIHGLVEMIERYIDAGDTKKVLNSSQRITRSIETMTGLIDTLYAYTNADTKVVLEPIDMQQVIDDTLSNLEQLVNKREAKISCETLPMVIGNKSLLIQLLQNIIANSIKYCEAKAPLIHIKASKQEDAMWLFSLQDNGIGIPDKYYKKIFEPFARLHGTEKYEGSGLGLATCKKIIERHGGKIWCESKEGEGTIFFFTLPAENSAN